MLGGPPAPRRRVTLAPGSEALHREILTALLPADHASLTLVDIGCGDASVTRTMAARRRTFVDVARSAHAPEPFIQADAIDFLQGPAPDPDLVFCLDMIEHLERTAGEQLLALVTSRARRLAVFFTPLGPMLINPADPTGHKAGWWPDEFEALSYRTWAFPRFHAPWLDGMVWGAFYAWRWTRPEPVAEQRLAAIATRLGLTEDAGGIDDVSLVPTSGEEAADHWRRLREIYRPRLFPTGV
jgi:hypothetical protein